MNRICFCLLLFMFVAVNTSYGQKQGYVWVFGDSAGLDFNSGTPLPIVTANSSPCSVSSLADENGNLLYYVGIPAPLLNNNGALNKLAVFDASHQVIQNGSSFLGRFYETDGSLILPAAGDSNLIYIFHIGDGIPRLLFSVIDKRLNNGKGAVSIKNSAIGGGIGTAYLEAIRHGNGRDWWILSHQNVWGNPSRFFKYMLDLSGLHFHSEQIIGDSLLGGGVMVASPDGNMIAISDYVYDVLDLYEFDRCSGQLTMIAELGNRTGSIFGTAGNYGVSFSPNSELLYGSTFSTMFQWDLTAMNISSTKTLIYQRNDTLVIPDTANFAGHLLGPDGKIYITTNLRETKLVPYSTYFTPFNMNLSVIENPNQLGLACNFFPASQSLGGRKSGWDMPNIPNFALGRLQGSLCDTLTSVSEITKKGFKVSVSPNPVLSTVNLVINAPPNLRLDDLQLEIYDTMGRQVRSAFLGSERAYTFNRRNLSSGSYYYRLYSEEGGVVTGKMMLQ